MRIAQETLNALADKAFRANGHLLRVGDYLRQTGVSLDTQGELEAGRQIVITLLHELVRAGADDPTETMQAELREQARRAGFAVREPEPLSLTLLTSEKARRYAEAIRAAATACQDMEAERGIEDGFAEVLAGYAAIAEEEAFGRQSHSECTENEERA